MMWIWSFLPIETSLIFGINSLILFIDLYLCLLVWFIWSGTGKTSGLRYSARVHVDTKLENDKVAEQLFYADMSAHKMESEMFKQSQ